MPRYHTRVIAIASALILLLTSQGLAAETSSRSITGKHVAMVIAYSDFEDTEFRTPRKMFETLGAKVTIVSSKLGLANGMYGHEVKTDVLIDKLDVSAFDAVVFVGGVGVQKEYWQNTKAHAVARQAVGQGKVLAAICWAPVILANAKVLEGKKATGNKYENAHEILTRKGCKYTGEPVTVDGKVITGYGPETAQPFAEAVIDALRQP